MTAAVPFAFRTIRQAKRALWLYTVGEVKAMKHETPVFRSLEIIECRIREKLTVENIAGSVYFSKYHYQRLFREIVGGSVMDYVNKRKLTLAGKELLASDATILDIALKFGFDSHEGFTRSFKSYMGVTPLEYRRYRLTAISQKRVKEKCVMPYAKATDEILRELNDFIAKTRETADSARKGCGVFAYHPFWQKIAGATDALADTVQDVLERVAAIGERPDEISGRFAVIRVLEDAAFQSNLLSFHIGLMTARGLPEHRRAQQPLCQKYVELARFSALKADRVIRFFSELSALIFDDMRKAAAEKMQSVLQKGRSAADRIVGYSYIRDGVAEVVCRLAETPLEEIRVSMLEDLLFRLRIIALAADMDVFRSPKDEALFAGIPDFQESLSEAADYFRSLVQRAETPAAERSGPRYTKDIAFQGEILLFFTRGEVSREKLGRLLDGGQTAAYAQICDRIERFLQFTYDAGDDTVYPEIAERLYGIRAALSAEAEKLAEKGGAVQFLADAFGGLADSVKRLPGPDTGSSSSQAEHSDC